MRRAVIDMALQLAGESGEDRVSLREVARRIGVSSGAPFRHFASHEALMQAIAEEALEGLRLQIERGQRGAAARDSLAALKAMGESFLDWALQHPTAFRLTSSRRLYRFDSSERLRAQFAALRSHTLQAVRQAQAAGHFVGASPEQAALGLRAMAYGLARMHIDGQLPQWEVPAGAVPETLKQTLSLMVDSLASSTAGQPLKRSQR
ncbi:TetR/AcrR family transcriptional regulator [Paucibacter sp. APW11]|uniref:TetR/AcrR family transcriptional regulator n=1 Tax=Roseateles aquae TaxID=3077235 RepID=A0ABU3PCT5_9BURK|nr:TetR/AcrR family transcriptional regulator [Paucibacter sp. APW11]MDT9000394.1 TetR/AcrR family transcriptional regulator [Paucibacter sp. APW11]